MMMMLVLVFDKVSVPQMFVFSVAEDNFTWASLFSLIHIGQLLTNRDTDKSSTYYNLVFLVKIVSLTVLRLCKFCDHIIGFGGNMPVLCPILLIWYSSRKYYKGLHIHLKRPNIECNFWLIMTVTAHSETLHQDKRSVKPLKFSALNPFIFFLQLNLMVIQMEVEHGIWNVHFYLWLCISNDAN